ncbi:hypothetical protein HanIR_Chr03g0127581 [Helianthus annuus]|nr:hypothetical protein HanIR_Chr03g0127581 [Helianthus annuus]
MKKLKVVCPQIDNPRMVKMCMYVTSEQLPLRFGMCQKVTLWFSVVYFRLIIYSALSLFFLSLFFLSLCFFKFM